MKNFSLLSLSMVLALGACCQIHRPPVNNSPLPAAHLGLFVDGGDSLSFCGDGESVDWVLTEKTAAATGLPRRGKGWYVFKFWHGKVRYDDATTFQMGDDSAAYEFAIIRKVDSLSICVATMGEHPDSLYFYTNMMVGNKEQ